MMTCRQLGGNRYDLLQGNAPASSCGIAENHEPRFEPGASRK
jgi:hypothetical protein